MILKMLSFIRPDPDSIINSQDTQSIIFFYKITLVVGSGAIWGIGRYEKRYKIKFEKV